MAFERSRTDSGGLDVPRGERALSTSSLTIPSITTSLREQVANQFSGRVTKRPWYRLWPATIAVARPPRVRIRASVHVDFQNVIMWDKAATIEHFLGRTTADRAVPAKPLIDKMGIDSRGAGTDFPVNLINPPLNMYIMMTPKDSNGNVYASRLNS